MLFTRAAVAAIALTALTVSLSACQTDDLFSSSDAGTVTATSSAAPQYTAPRPSLVMTDEPAPEVIYKPGSRDTMLASDDAVPVPVRKPLATVGSSSKTLVARKADDLARELAGEQRSVDGFRDRLSSLRSTSDAQAAEYYGIVAGIATELQSGTTAGNPVLTERWNTAQNKLDAMSTSAGALSALTADLTAEASKLAYLQETVRATYGLSGAVKGDRERLQGLEDDVNQTIVEINRLLTTTGDETNRRTATLRAENLNMQTLSLAIANGEMYGQNMTNSLFKKAAEDGAGFLVGNNETGTATPAGRRPLVVIRFNRPHVDYREAVYSAVSQALDRYPSAKFDLVAVSPAEGNPAQMALASTEARKNGEGVLRALTQMGVPMERISLNAANSGGVSNSEVHLFIR